MTDVYAGKKKEILEKLDKYLDEMSKKGYGEIGFTITFKSGLPQLIRYNQQYTDVIFTN